MSLNKAPSSKNIYSNNPLKAVEEINWRDLAKTDNFPPVLPEEYFTLPEDLSSARIFSFLNESSVPVRRSVSDLGDGSYSIDFTWSSDYLRVVQRKNEIKYIREFINQSKGRFRVTLLHNYRRFSISNIIGLRIKQ